LVDSVESMMTHGFANPKFTKTIFCRKEVKIWKNGNKWAVTIKEEYVGKQTANREQIQETHGR